MGPWTILVAVDFSECSRAALEAAGRLAADLRARIVLAHAFAKPPHIPPGGHPDPISKAMLEVTQEEAMALSSDWAQGLRRQGLDVEVATVEGKAADFVLDAARTRNAGLIVVGTHGRTGLRRVALGSVAEAILRGADRPVLAVPLAGKGRK